MLDSECGTGGLCLPTGACVAAANIIHATTMGKDMPGCGAPGANACKLERALTEVTATKNVIKLDDLAPAIYSANGFIVGKDVTIDARGALIKRGNDGTILTINMDRTTTIFGGTIEGATNGDGISCGPNATLTLDGTTIDTIEKSAINASSGCKLTLTHVNINNTSLKTGQFLPAILTAGASITLSRSNFFSNHGGGISVTNGTFVIVGNAFVANGDTLIPPTNPVGAVSINTTTSDPMNRIEFNSISGNSTISTKPPGIDCTAGTGPINTAIARNNIIWNNNGNLVPQVGGTCKHAYSDIGMLTVGGPNDGGNNLSIDPVFQAALDLHLQSASQAIRYADPMAKLDGVAAKDIDGDPRVAPADIGVDQRPR